MSLRILHSSAAVAAMLFCLAPAMAQTMKPITCADIAAVTHDEEITMDDFKKLMIAGGFEAASVDQDMATQCRAATVIDRVDLARRLAVKADRSEIRIEARVVNTNGPCRLTEIELDGC